MLNEYDYEGLGYMCGITVNPREAPAGQKNGTPPLPYPRICGGFDITC